jgi:diadenylate cyclase
VIERLLALYRDALPQLTWLAVVDILLVAFLIYQILSIVRGRRAAQVLTGLIILVGAYLIAANTGLELLRGVLQTLAPYSAFALIVMFQSEIRRFLARLGRRTWLGFGGRLQNRESIDEILLAIEHLAAHKTGALIVVERDIGLRTFVESGVLLEAHLSRDLLLTIFYPGCALHDGAAIVQGDRIAAAACFLPLSSNPAIASKLGTRHRAAIGVTEESDCLSLVVSEETGTVSVCYHGEIEREVTMQRVEEWLTQHMARKGEAKPTAEPVIVRGREA